MASQPRDTPKDVGRDIGRDISLKLAAITRQQSKRFARQMEGEGVTRAQWSVIVVIAHRPGASQRLIAEALDISEAAAGRMIDRLRQDGLLERRPSTDDKRAYCVHLTDAAQPILTRLGAIAAILEKDTYCGVDADDMAKLDAILARIYRNVTA